MAAKRTGISRRSILKSEAALVTSRIASHVAGTTEASAASSIESLADFHREYLGFRYPGMKGASVGLVAGRAGVRDGTIQHRETLGWLKQ
jgi:hypothetical protein